MTKQELLDLFSTFTREDWQAMDTLRNTAFQPTQEEINTQSQQLQAQRTELIASKLALLWVTRPETITKEFALGFLTSINAEQFIWDDLSSWINDQEILFGDLDTAFDDLVIRYL